MAKQVGIEYLMVAENGKLVRKMRVIERVPEVGWVPASDLMDVQDSLDINTLEQFLDERFPENKRAA